MMPVFVLSQVTGVNPCDIHNRTCTMQSFSRCLASLILATAALANASAAQPAGESDPAWWKQKGEVALRKARSWSIGSPERARNVILFVGDGMGVSTVTAARILEGQLRGERGEENSLSFEQFPHLALSKTYTVNQQVSDSAPTMSAMITGVKTLDGVLSVAGDIVAAEPSADKVAAAAQETLLELAEKAGLSTGVVSTARITHATPGATYAHTAARDWEADSDRPAGATVPDIASQLIDRFGKGGIGDGIEVVLGGGRAKFLPATAKDPEDKGATGARKDGRNLVKEWQRKFRGQFVFDQKGFEAADPARVTHLLGLFERSHMEFEADRKQDTAGEPSLAEMTTKAIRILSRNPKGYFLMVEAGRIDHGHHAGNAYRALTDAIALSDAVRAALAETAPEETLLVVTADHSHSFTIAGYAKRGNPILGKVVEVGQTEPATAEDGLPYTTAGYANGRGFHANAPGESVYALPARTGRIPDIATTDTTHPNYHQEALIPLEAETHGGEDVPVFALGPASQLVYGVQEESYIFYVMRHALAL